MFFNETKERTIVHVIESSQTTISKFIGLMFSKSLDIGKGLYMKKVVKVHTFFMKYPIDIFYIDKNNSVLRIDKNVKPWKVCKLCRLSEYIVETNSGVADEKNVEIGDKVFLKSN